jgi:tetratricopeptide (TPR) repeat protein
MESLELVVEKIKSVDSDIAALEECFADIEFRGVSWSIKDIQEWEGKISKLVAAVEEFTDLNDSIMTWDEGEQGVKDEVESRTDSSSARLENLTNDVNAKRTVAAEKLKNLGNDEFKRGKFPAALALYEEAIVYDPTNAVLYTNRALVFQKIDNWTDALTDAEHAVSLDPDMLKGHIILIKCLVSIPQSADHFNFYLLCCIHNNQPIKHYCTL